MNIDNFRERVDDIELAGKYGLIHQIDGNFGKELMAINEQKIKAFAKEIRADERKRCAQLCNEIYLKIVANVPRHEEGYVSKTVSEIAGAIMELK